MSQTPDGECQRKGCNDPATVTIEWLEVSGTYNYCDHHGRRGLQWFPELASEIDEEERGATAGTA